MPGRNDNFTRAGMGRPKGSKNKFSQFKNDLMKAYEKNGGLKWLTEWAKDNPTEFVSIVSKMLPKEINVKQSGEITVTHQSETISRVNEWIRQITVEEIRSDNEDTDTKRPLLSH